MPAEDCHSVPGRNHHCRSPSNGIAQLALERSILFELLEKSYLETQKLAL